jgi:hypothetical protein
MTWSFDAPFLDPLGQDLMCRLNGAIGNIKIAAQLS